MEHEAREARPIGAQGAFVSNSMHYIYAPAPFAAPSIPGYTRRLLTEKRCLPGSPRNAHRSAPLDTGFRSLQSHFVSVPRNLTREICLGD